MSNNVFRARVAVSSWVKSSIIPNSDDLAIKSIETACKREKGKGKGKGKAKDGDRDGPKVVEPEGMVTSNIVEDAISTVNTYNNKYFDELKGSLKLVTI